jgi:predicted flap endonuclease-1-like 5' DNA nuclease
MMTVFDANLILLIIAVAIGFVIGLWIYRRPRTGADIRLDSDTNIDARPYLDQPDEPPSPPAMLRGAAPSAQRTRLIRDGIDTHEQRGIADQGAAATADVAGQLLGVKAHSELPGATDTPDNLQLLKGVGPKLAQKLIDQGLIRFEQLAGLTETEVAMLEDKLGPFKGRLTRDRVIEQANYLARGDTDGFEARFGRLGGA